MNKYVLGLALAAAVLIGGAGAAYGRQVSNSIVPTIKVNTPTGTLLTLKTSELSILPQASTTISLNGVSTVEQGPTLASLLTLAGVQYNAACKNDELRWWIEATASNGQAATLTAGEIDPFFGNRPAILSISANGQFLTSKGPTLIVPNDPAGQRNLKGVSVITVGRATAQLPSVTPACSPTVAPVTPPPPGSVVINGDVSSPQTLSFAQLQAVQPQLNQTVTFLNGSTPSTQQRERPDPGVGDRLGEAEVPRLRPDRQASVLRRDHLGDRRLHGARVVGRARSRTSTGTTSSSRSSRTARHSRRSAHATRCPATCAAAATSPAAPSSRCSAPRPRCGSRAARTQRRRSSTRASRAARRHVGGPGTV